MDINRRHLIGASAAGAAGALAMSTDAARAAQLDVRRSGATPRNMASGPAAPTTRPKPCSARSTRPRARRCRWRCRPASIAPRQLRLQSGTQLVGVRGATRLVFNGGASMLSGEGASHIGLVNITLDGGGIPLPTRRGLVHCLGGRDIRITDCEITGSGGNGIWFENVSGDISGNIITRSATTAIVSFDAQGLHGRRAIPSRAPTTTASKSCAPPSATTARWSRTTASRTSRPAPAAPANTATPSTRFVPAM